MSSPSGCCGCWPTRLGFPLPDELRPLLAALLIGVVTDYCVLFLFAFRDHLVRGAHRHAAAARAAAAEGPIVAVAGLTVAGGTAALLAANFPIFRAFGPAMAVTVLVGLAVSVTLVPALMAILGRWLFLPWDPARWAAKLNRRTTRRAGLLVRIVVNRAGAAVAALLAVGVLVAAAAPIVNMRLDASFTGPVPRDDPVREGADLLDTSGVGGITAPTEILVEGPNITTQRDALDAMQAAIADQPGVARVLGPAQNPLPEEYGVVLSRDGTAARYIVVFAGDPLGGESIEHLESLSAELPALADAAGLHDVTISVTGQTAIAAELAAITRQNLLITLLAAFGIELLILIVYLRAFLAPLLLLACSALGVARRSRSHRAGLPGRRRRHRPDLLRRVRHVGAAAGARFGLQRLHSRSHLARGRPASTRPRDRPGHAGQRAGGERRGSHPRRHLCDGGDHSAGHLPPARVHDVGRPAARHIHRSAGADAGRADTARAVGRLARSAHHDGGHLRRGPPAGPPSGQPCGRVRPRRASTRAACRRGPGDDDVPGSRHASRSGRETVRSPHSGAAVPALMIVLFLVTVALLLWAADWLARTVAQNQLADQIHQQTGRFDAAHGRDRRDGVSAAGPARTVRRGRRSHFPN